MNNDQSHIAAFPEARAKRLTKKKSIWLLALFSVMVISLGGGLVGGMLGYIGNQAGSLRGANFYQWWPWFLAFWVSTAGMWMYTKIWARLDEMAKRAHLVAFYWGGSVAMGILAPFAVMPLKFEQYKIALIEGLNYSATQSFGLGIAVALGAITLGYSVVWLVWWATKR